MLGIRLGQNISPVPPLSSDHCSEPDRGFSPNLQHLEAITVYNVFLLEGEFGPEHAS